MSARLEHALLAAALGVVVFACYAGALDHEFVFDDEKLVVENVTIRDLGNVPSIIASAFVNRPYLAHDNWIDPGYRPVRMISYAIDYALFCRARGPTPAPFRRTNIVLHLLNALLVGAIAARLIGRAARWPAAFLFGLHPLATECVTYVSGRRDVLFALFYLGALVLFLDHRSRDPDRRDRAGAWRGPAAAALLILALGTKEMAATLPLACLGIDLALGGLRSARRHAATHAALLLLTALYSILVVFFKNPNATASEVAGRVGGSAPAAAMTMARVVWHYLGLIVFPGTLSADYSFDAFPASRGLFDPATTLLALAGLGLLGWLLLRLFRSGARVEAAAGAFFFLALLPVLQIIPHPEPIAERYLYVPMIGPLVLAVRGLSLLAGAGRARSCKLVLVAALFALAARTVVRNRDWRDEETLFASAVRAHPRCARANLAVAKALISRGQDRAALDPLDRCIEVLPRKSWDTRAGGLLVTALFERAKARAEVGLFDEALRDLDTVLKERTSAGALVADSAQFAHVRLNRAATLKRKADAQGSAATAGHSDADSAKERAAASYDAARAEYAEVIRLLDGFEPPDESAARAAAIARREAGLELGLLLIGRGEEDAGLTRLAEAAGPTPTADTERAWDVLGRARLRADDAPGAERVFRALAGAHLSGEKEALYLLAECLDRRGDVPGAREALVHALAIDPRFAAAHYSLGDLELKLGELDRAERDFTAVLLERPRDRRVRLKLTEVAIRRASAKSGQGPEKPRVPPVEPALAARQKAERLIQMSEQAWTSHRPIGAVKALEAAEDADPTWAEPSELLGALLESLAQPEDARKAYERALAREPGRESAKKALARLRGER